MNKQSKKTEQALAVDEQPINVDVASPKAGSKTSVKPSLTKEINGPKGLEPTRYGDWESKGRCYDF